MPTGEELLAQRAHLLFRHNADERITEFNEPWPWGTRPGPLVYLSRAVGSQIVRFRADAPPGLVEAVQAFVDALPLRASLPSEDDGTADALNAIAAPSVPGATGAAGPVFAFPAPLFPLGAIQLYPGTAGLLHPSLVTWAPDLPYARPAFVAIVDRQAVAICASVRLTAGAAEAGVETALDYRGRGAAGLATIAWAEAVRKAGRTPFYSTSWSNKASLAVARKLELVPVAEDIRLVEPSPNG